MEADNMHWIHPGLLDRFNFQNAEFYLLLQGTLNSIMC